MSRDESPRQPRQEAEPLLGWLRFQFQDPSGIRPADFYTIKSHLAGEHFTDAEWDRIGRKRRYGPARTLREFWDLVREDLQAHLEEGEPIDVTTVVLDADQHEQLSQLVGNRRSRAFQRELAFLWIDLGPRSKRVR